MEKIPTRLNYLDSLRGLAAFGVVFCHLACVFWNALYYEENAATVFEQIWNKTPLNAITNGNLPVQFFFVLSGFLITKNIYTRNTTDGFRVLGKKFTNLLKLVIPGILLPFLLMRLHLMVHQAALAQDESLVFVKYYNNFSPTLGSALSDFFYTFTEKSNYNGPMWTIHFELFGSLLITVLSSFVSSNVEGFWKRKLSYILFYLIIGVMNQNYCGFIAGAITYDVLDSLMNQSAGQTDRFSFLRRTPVKLLLLAAGFYFAAINMNVTGIWYPLHFLSQLSAQFRIWGVCLCLFVLMLSPMLQKMLSARFLVKLGKLSRFIFIFHWPMILSVGCWLFIRLYSTLSRGLLLVVAAGASILGTVLFSLLYSHFEAFLSAVICRSSSRTKLTPR
ncbi:MAG: acyltransferase [Oscillospiraceae bacterium]|nr:acyltransferase [Oscillospiraceae bacterium]